MAAIEGLSGKRWPGHPHRQDDELLSSWFVRTAHANHIKPQSFGSLVFGKRAFVMTRDLDRWVTAGHIEALSEQTASTPEELRDGLLSSYAGIVFGQHATHGRTRWILPSVSYLCQRRRHGMQFCPLCLFFDKEPYYRRRWRMAFTTICDVHGTLLHDRCPECEAPVIFFRDNVGDKYSHRIGDMVSCWECGFDLRRAPAYGPPGPDGKTIMALRSLISFHDMGWWFQGRDSVQYGPLYFDVLHYLTAYLMTSYGRRFLDAIEAETGWGMDVIWERGRIGFQSQPLDYRHQMMMAILWLLDEWPDRFVRVAKSIGATQSQINEGHQLPYWFESVLRQELGNGFYHLTAEEVQSAVGYLEKSGEDISASAIRRLVGGNPGSQAVKPYVKAAHRPLDGELLRRVIEKYDAVHAGMPPACRPRLVWQRDKTILLLISMTGWDYRKVRKLKTGDIPLKASDYPGLSNVMLDEVNTLLLTYRHETRSHLADISSGSSLFIKWRGGVLSGESWRTRRLKYDHAAFA